MRLPRLAPETSRGPLRGQFSQRGPDPCLNAESELLGLLIGCSGPDHRGPDKGREARAPAAEAP